MPKEFPFDTRLPQQVLLVINEKYREKMSQVIFQLWVNIF